MTWYRLAFIIDILPDVRYDNTITLGVLLHALILCLLISVCHRQAMRVLRRIEDKQDKIMSTLTTHVKKTDAL